MVKVVKKGMRGECPVAGAGAPGSGAPRIPFLTAFTIDFSRFEGHFCCPVWVLRRDSFWERVWYGLRTNLGYCCFFVFCFVFIVSDVLAPNKAQWSYRTCLRAVLRHARIKSTADVSAETRLREIQDKWEKRPICTSVCVELWQRYLVDMAYHVAGDEKEAVELVMQYMPVYSDRVLPDELIDILKDTGISICQHCKELP